MAKMPKAKRAKVKWNHLPQRSRCRDRYERAFRRSLQQAIGETESEEDGGNNAEGRGERISGSSSSSTEDDVSQSHRRRHQTGILHEAQHNVRHMNLLVYFGQAHLK